MINNRVEFVVVTYPVDFPQFYLLVKSIKKYHDKHYRLRVIYDDSINSIDHEAIYNKVVNLIKEELSKFEVTVECKPKHIESSDGWITQQLLKWYLAYTSTAEWQYVLDAKNFYLRPYVIPRTLIKNRAPGFKIEFETEFDQLAQKISHEFISKHVIRPAPQKFCALTPWAWKVSEIRNMLDTLWPNREWEYLQTLPGTEWFLYLSWVAGQVEYYDRRLVDGLWNQRIDTSNLSHSVTMPFIPFGVHHRSCNMPEYIKITETVLLSRNILKENEIETWKDHIQDVELAYASHLSILRNSVQVREQELKNTI